jgi:DNA helicase-2/ATP-dependent DNA helicase PcrA
MAQYMIVKKLAQQRNNICVVGDDAQSIYAFRGARIENILNFRKDYPNYQLYKLEQNYRSTQTIVNAANTLIEKNKNRIPKVIFLFNAQGERLKIFIVGTDQEEGYVVAASILDMKYQHQLFNKDFAILYRTNAQSRIFEEALRKRNIPYKIYGGLSFYERKEIKDVLAYGRLLVNP